MKDNSKEDIHYSKEDIQCWTTEWKEKRTSTSEGKDSPGPSQRHQLDACVLSLWKQWANSLRGCVLRFGIVAYEYTCMTAIKAWNTPTLLCLSKCFCFSLRGKQHVPKRLVGVAGGSAASAVHQAAPQSQRRVNCRGKDVSKTQAQLSDDITTPFQSNLGAISSSRVFWPQL